MKKGINFFLFLAFMAFAYLQLNDPDPWIWVLVYGAVGLLALLQMFEPVNKKLLWVLFGLTLAYALYHLGFMLDFISAPEKEELFGEMQEDKPYLEGTREFLGLLMAAGAYYYMIRRADDGLGSRADDGA